MLSSCRHQRSSDSEAPVSPKELHCSLFNGKHSLKIVINSPPCEVFTKSMFYIRYRQSPIRRFRLGTEKLVGAYKRSNSKTKP